MTWAQRLKRVLKIDVETCRVCGGTARVIACIEDPVVIKQIVDHLKHKAETSEPSPLPESRARRLGCSRGCLTDEPKSQRFKSKCCPHTAAAGIRRAGWQEWSRLWRKSGRIYSDVSGIQAHSGLSNGCRGSHSRSELLLQSI
jgi:hypothetical protein